MVVHNETDWTNPLYGKGWTIELEDLTNAVRPAFGFWLFPNETFGGFGPDDEPLPNGERNGKDWKDLSQFHPQLALSTLL